MNMIVFLKGLLMGFCDIIPGVSGGTIAFITGIYEQLMKAVANIDSKFLSLVFKGKFSKAMKKIDVYFLLTLFSGIILAILIGSRAMHYLLENYFTYTIAFFIGLILASSRIISKSIKKYTLNDVSFAAIGFVVGLSFAFIVPMDASPNIFYILLGGFFAVSAMFLPGISGAFILLIMGLYEYMIGALKNFDLMTIFVFLIGAVAGALVISKIINYLFKLHKNKTLLLLLGLVIGALSVPVKKLIVLIPELSIWQILLIGLFIVVGIFSVLLISIYDRK